MSRPAPSPRAPSMVRPPAAMRWFSRGLLLAATALGGIMFGAQARADGPVRAMPIHAPKSQPEAPASFTGTVSNTDPMTFQADHVAYDSKNGIATWTGNVQLWQNDQIMRAGWYMTAIPALPQRGATWPLSSLTARCCLPNMPS